MLSVIENIKTLGTNHFEREERELSNSVRRPGIPSYNALVNNESSSYSNFRENEIKCFASHGHNSGGTEFSGEFNKLSVELNQRITQKWKN